VLSDVSIKRPVFATVVSLVLVIFGLFSFTRLSIREYPNIDVPIVSVTTTYTGASAAVIESQITQIIENSVSGIEGIRSIVSSSRDGSSLVTVEFRLSRSVDEAAADMRDKVSRIIAKLPEAADTPVIAKVDGDARPILWFALFSTKLNPVELTDYAQRTLVDRLATVPGVSSVRIAGERKMAMRIWLKKREMAAREISVQDIESALKRQNVELPGGRIESRQREFTVRTDTGLRTPEQFQNLVITTKDGYAVKLGEVADVRVEAEETRGEVRDTGREAVGLGILKQSTANTLEVAEGVKAEMEALRSTLPDGVRMEISYDTSLFISQSIYEVFHALLVAVLLVIAVIFIFLRTVRATLIPAIAIPVSMIGSFIVLAALGYSINVLTLLAFVLAIGLVVDDAIVVLENIHRRIEEGEPPLLAAVRGARQIGFAVISTTLVLVAVFVPISFLQGNVGRLFAEFGISVAAAVLFSGLVALSLSPMMCSKLLKPVHSEGLLHRLTEPVFVGMNRGYAWLLDRALAAPLVVVALAVAVCLSAVALFKTLPREFAPVEDRGSFLISITAPEGASIDYTRRYMRQVEATLEPYLKGGSMTRYFANLAPSWGRPGEVKQAFIFARLAPWESRTIKQQQITRELFPKLAAIPGVRAFAVNPPAFGQSATQQPLQIVLGGPSYEELAEWRNLLFERMAQNPGIQNANANYDETKPQLRVDIDAQRAADMGISIEDIGRTLETMLGSRNVTTFNDRGQEYNVVLQARPEDRVTPRDLSNIFVRSAATRQLVPLSNLVRLIDFAGPSDLNRFDRQRSITISANLATGYSLGQALEYVEEVVRNELPPHARLSYRGESREFKESSYSLYITFAVALLVVFLVLAAQFESYVNPFVIMLTVPLAVTGALGALVVTGLSVNVYTQIGMIMLIGIVAKNGILIVEFANQLRAAGYDIMAATRESSVTRLRPILMTSIATAIGALPLAMAHGAGAESREGVGVVIVGGTMFATLLSLFVVPVFYSLLARGTKAVTHVEEAITLLERQERERREAARAAGEARPHAAD
jgi:multidrug efflux pump